MPFSEMIVGVAVGLFFLLGFIHLVRLVQAWMLHRTLRAAIKQDSEQAGILIDRIGQGGLGSKAEAGPDDRTGLVLIAVGVALAGFSMIAGDPEWLRYGLGAALFPGLVGAALLIRHYALRRTAEPDVATGA